MALKKHQKILPPDLKSGPCILYTNNMERNFLKRLAEECGYFFQADDEGPGLLAFHRANPAAILILTKIRDEDSPYVSKITTMNFKEGICFLDDILKFQSPKLWHMGRNLMGKTVPDKDGGK